MANILKFKVTNKVDGTLGLGFANPSAGETVKLTDVQLKQMTAVRVAIEKGYLEPMGEDSSDVSSTMMEYWDGKIAYNKNMMPASAVTLVPPIAASSLVNAVGADLAAGFTFGKKVAITGFKARFTIAPLTAATAAPRLLVTAGDATPATPTLLTAYDDTAGTYTAATNGSIAAAAPITWAADDILIIGYSSKFSSVVFDRTAANTAATLAVPYYWDGSAWAAFSDYDDYTLEVATKTMSRAAAGDKSRIVWWEQPDDWVAGGPTGSSATSSMYCVGLKVDGALTSLAGASFYVVADTPMGDINLGTGGAAAPAAVVQKLSTTYSDKTDVSVAWSMNGFTTTDYIWVGFSTPQTGFAVNVTGVNGNAETAVVTYWNGITWAACPTITDGTESGGATWAQDGTITMATIPSDWTAVAASDSNVLSTNAPTTVSTDELYWLRYTVTGALDATGTGVIQYGVPGLNIWHEIEPEYVTFVDDDQEMHVFVVDENTTIANLNINAMVADI